MCASWIMLTSLAPSPMPSVMTPVLLTSAVTRAFCLGDTRQHTTAAHARPTCARGPNPSCLTRRVSSLGDQRHCASSLRRPAPGCKQGLYKCSEALSGCTSLREEALPSGYAWFTDQGQQPLAHVRPKGMRLFSIALLRHTYSS